MKTMKKMMTWIAVVGLVLGMAPGAMAAGTIYEYTSGSRPIIVFSLSTESEFANQGLYPTGGTFTEWTSGDSWTIPESFNSIVYLVVGGGGGGGGKTGGGGGAGGFLTGTLPSVTPGQSLTITVGAGGSGGAHGSAGQQGGSSFLTYLTTTIEAYGGGRGSSENGAQAPGGGETVGSGGGGTWAFISGGESESGQGNDGGDGLADSVNKYYLGGGGGGGGAGGAGSSASGSNAGDGGAGKEWEVTQLWYAAGGGGAAHSKGTGTPGQGGMGDTLKLGGDGGHTANTSTAGLPNTGSGGGAAGDGNGSAGGSGIVILTVPPPPAGTLFIVK